MHAKVGVADARDNGNFMMKASQASVLSQLSKVVLGSACFALAAAGAMNAANLGINSAKKALFADSLSISPSLLSWTKDLHPAFKISPTSISLQSPLDAVATDSFSENVSSQVQQGLKKIAHLEVAQHQAMHRARAVRSHIVLAAAKAVRNQVDEVKVSQSSAELAQPAVFVPITEAEKLQNVQAFLVSKFFVAMNDVPKVNTQIAQSADSLDTQSKVDSVLQLIARKPAKVHSAKAPVPVKVAQVEAPADTNVNGMDDEAERDESAPIVQSKVQKETPLQTVSPSKQIASASSALGGLSSQPSSSPIIHPITQVSAVYPPATPLVLKASSIQPPATAPPVITSNIEPQLPAAKLVEPSPALAGTLQPQSAVLTMAKSASQMWGNGYSAHQVAITPVGYSKKVTADTHRVLPPNNQNSVTQLTHELAPASLDTISSSSSAPMLVSSPQAAPLRPSFGPLLDRTSRWAFHEAFDWSTSVIDPKVEVLSQEGKFPEQVQARGQSAGQTLGWRIAKANQHWATLFWSTPSQEEVPMLNALSAKMLSIKASAALQNDAGIVLAKVSAGWSLEFSGRSERALIFDRNNHILASSATEGSNGSDRYYVFLNASPGEQILYLNHAGGETGALAVPVLGGVMAYVDLTQVEKRTISGRILEAADSSPHGVSGIRVQVVGSGMSTVTGSSGDFHIDNVIAFGDQSLYLETETQKSFPHRYKLSPSATTHLSLFHLNESQVHEWIGQLEGGVSSESGLILGALPTLSASQEDRKPQVGTRSLANGPTLTPETYTLSGSGQLMVKTPLNGVRSRFLSVQVPEGPTLVEVVDKDNRLIWSEITVVSPRVLTIVGPY
jgi:hypothetical protein